jgi:hypothetical protein
MKKLLTVVVAAVIVMSLSAEAHSFGAYLSYWNGQDIDNGYGVGLKHKFQIVPIFSVEARASWLKFSDDPVDLNLFPLEAMGRAKLGLFYLGAGVGYYIFDAKDASVDNTVGAFGVAGVEFALAGLGGFAELKYTYADTKTESDADLDGSGIGVNVGIIFDWF